MSHQQKIQDLKLDIIRYAKACKSEWPRPIDYMNLIDAQHELRSLEFIKTDTPEHIKKSDSPIWFKRLIYWNEHTPQETNYV